MRETTENRVLKVGRKCSDYQGILEMSQRCQNCRYNRFVNGEIAHQECIPHSQNDALLKGAPEEVDRTFFMEWLSKHPYKEKEL